MNELTERDRKVLQMIQEGKSNGEMAEILGIDAGAVKFQVRRLFQAYGVVNRTQLVGVVRHLPPKVGPQSNDSKRHATT